ncbi:MAG: DUF115 domain-containing protein [Myxococcales bacterium]|nr:DUF115 domain-containing protein [Myxococcales bacterium]
MNRDQMRRVFSPRERTALKLMTRAGLRRAFYAWYRATRSSSPGIGQFRDIHSGQRCFVLGCGPSLKQHDPAPLANEFTFGMNGTFLLHDWLGFESTYYAVEDALFHEDRFQDIKDLVRASVSFFPLQLECHGFNRSNRYYYRGIQDFDDVQSANWPAFSNDATRLLFSGGTVTYICLQLAYFMGFEEVILLGMDHAYSKPDDLIVRGHEWTSTGADPNHFDPDYFGPGYRWRDPQTHRMEKSYTVARRVFERSGRRIVNASVGGKLEVFERVDYESLFSSL